MIDVTANVACPRCGAPMVTRRNRSSGEEFLGCSGFPSCRATLAFATGQSSSRKAAPFKPRVWKAGRRREFGDDMELFVARLLGRNLGFVGALVLRVVLLVVVLVLMINLIGPFSSWFGTFFASQIHLAPTTGP